MMNTDSPKAPYMHIVGIGPGMAAEGNPGDLSVYPQSSFIRMTVRNYY
jgi:hypothetical protein